MFETALPAFILISIALFWFINLLTGGKNIVDERTPPASENTRDEGPLKTPRLPADACQHCGASDVFLIDEKGNIICGECGLPAPS